MYSFESSPAAELEEVFPDEVLMENLREAFDGELNADSMGCHCHHIELAIKHACNVTSRVALALTRMDDFAKATRNNEPTRRYLRNKPEGFIRIPARGETRWSSLFRELTKFFEMFPFLEVISAISRNRKVISGT